MIFPGKATFPTWPPKPVTNWESSIVYPLYQLGNPQHRVFRTNFWLTLVRPGVEQPPDIVQFRVPLEIKIDVSICVSFKYPYVFKFKKKGTSHYFSSCPCADEPVELKNPQHQHPTD
uniref:39S ribosomal protein L23, mitochondrial n=1 Tax=Eptatretus burgeri TaxID=7764 RepID=A0A8C4NDP6_EPTBU